MSANGTPPTFDQAFATLRQFARARSPVERCELCSTGLAHEHPHLVEIACGRLCVPVKPVPLCLTGWRTGKYRRVSRRAQFLTNFGITDVQWESLLIPINTAFFFLSSVEGKMVALYPSPAGAVESQLSLDAWNEIVQENPVLSQLQPDIEALLVNRVGQAHELSRAEYYIAPIDECYKLVGLIRANWKGLSGGSEVWAEIGRFFSESRSCADVTDGDEGLSNPTN